MGAKKAKGKGKAIAKKSDTKSAETKKGKDIVEVRGNIDNLVKESAELIAIEVIKVALTGQLATAKYLFEAVGLYPPTEQTVAPPIETSLAHTLLTRMGLPLTPLVSDEESVPVASTLIARDAATEASGVAQKDPEKECEAEPASVEGEE
jgi:hypothetical protein